VEIAFPWKVLGELARRPAPPRDGDQWRVNFSRVQWRHEVADGKYRKVPGTREDNWVWSPQGVINMHRPETWGYVQFSTGRASEVEFRPDPALAARQALHLIYYSQREYRAKHGRWARSLEELRLPRLADASFVGGPRLATTDDLFQATITIRLPGGTRQRWHIRQDARVWGD
jgi:hypothetical protein